MDEPLAALDVGLKRDILPYLERLHDELDIPVVYVTHSPDEMARLGDFLVLMERGRVRGQGSLPRMLSELDMLSAFAEEPGVAFDCSGLTSYAWARAGIALPRSSRSQYSALTRVPIAAAQPGDLIFSYSPISHVGIYLGGGQMVHAPRTGDVVKVSYVSWAKVIGVGRPK